MDDIEAARIAIESAKEEASNPTVKIMLAALRQIKSDPKHHKLSTESKEHLLAALAAAE